MQFEDANLLRPIFRSWLSRAGVNLESTGGGQGRSGFGCGPLEKDQAPKLKGLHVHTKHLQEITLDHEDCFFAILAANHSNVLALKDAHRAQGWYRRSLMASSENRHRRRVVPANLQDVVNDGS